jgi:hypothetical protein
LLIVSFALSGVPLFQRAVLLGGSAYAPWSLVEAMESNSMKLARMLNCTTRHWGAAGTAGASSSSSPTGQQQQPGYFHQQPNQQAENLYSSRDNQQLFGPEGVSSPDYPHLISRGMPGAPSGVLEYQPQQGAGGQQQGRMGATEYIRSSMPGMQSYHQHGHVHQHFEPVALSEAESDSIWRCLRNSPLKDFMNAVRGITHRAIVYYWWDKFDYL